MSNESETLDFYDNNAKAFADMTVNLDFSYNQDQFLKYLKPASLILDFGCGSGRDTKAFLERGYAVEAIDGSVEFCKLASEYTGIKVKQMYFQNLSEQEKYDGVWACSSILHLTLEELKRTLIKIANALKEQGILYASFKYGEFEGMRHGRYFTDMTMEKFHALLEEIHGYQIEEEWVKEDARPERAEEKWLNVILRKKIG